MTPAWVQWLSALLTPVIGLLAGYIAYEQMRTARAKLRLDLFDKRVALYEAAMTFLAHVGTSGTVTHAERVAFFREVRNSRFLFEPTVHERMVTIYQRAGDLLFAEALQTGPQPDKQQEAIEAKWKTLLPWFATQLDEMPNLFIPYLRVDAPSVWQRAWSCIRRSIPHWRFLAKRRV